MSGEILLSTAYLPPIEYFALITGKQSVLIEKEENYLKQSFRNRCYILSAGGSQLLTVPVLMGSIHKVPLKDIRIDYSKRWQKVHTGAIISSYRSSPYFLFYFDSIEKIINTNHQFLLDLNTELLLLIINILKINIRVSYTSEFDPVNNIEKESDFRYKINPKKHSSYSPKQYLQVFPDFENIRPVLSIIDLIFNTGPDAYQYF